MKRKAFIVAILFLIIIFSIIFSSTLGEGNPQERVYDLANLLSKEEKAKLEEVAYKYSVKRKTDFVILTISDPMDKDIVDYMEDFYDENELGYDKPHGNVAILTIDMKNRDVYLAGFYKGEKYLSDSRLDIIRDKITPDLSSGNYYDAFYSFIKTSYKYMGIRPGVNPENILFKLGFQIIISLVIGAVVVLVMAYNSGGKTTVNAATYQDPMNSKILSKSDRYIRTSVTKHRKPKPKSSSGGFSGGGSGGGITRGGHSHSGSRGKF